MDCCNMNPAAMGRSLLPGRPDGEHDILAPRPRWQPVPAADLRWAPHAAITSVHIHIAGATTMTSFFAGTGWFMAPSRVVTAAHVLDIRRAWSTVAGATSWHVEVVPAVSADVAAPFGATWATRIDRHPRFVDDVGSPWDLAVITVTPLAGLAASQCLGTQLAPEQAGLDVAVSGYAWNDGHPHTQFRHAGPVRTREGSNLYYDIDTEGGQSGSPLLWQTAAGEVAVGLHVGGQGHGQGAVARSLNRGLAFDASMLAWARSI
jgi:glutamyl endopeptidase